MEAPPLDPFGYLMERPPEGVPSLPMVLPESGEMLFLEVDAEGALRQSEGLAAPPSTSRAQAGRSRAEDAPLLGQSMQSLLAEVEADRRADALERARLAKAGFGSGSNLPMMVRSGAASAAVARGMTKKQREKARKSAEKWTDRYQPTHFMQLLTAEHINRSVRRSRKMCAAVHDPISHLCTALWD